MNENDAVQSKEKIILLSDSHGRFLSSKLLDRCPDVVKVTGTVKPNGRFQQVIEGFRDTAGELTSRDALMVLAGTNNIDENYEKPQLIDSVKSLVEGTANIFILPSFVRKRFNTVSSFLGSCISNVGLGTMFLFLPSPRYSQYAAQEVLG